MGHKALVWWLELIKCSRPFLYRKEHQGSYREGGHLQTLCGPKYIGVPLPFKGAPGFPASQHPRQYAFF